MSVFFDSLSKQTAFFFQSSLGFLQLLAVILTAVFLGSAVYFAVETGWLMTNMDRFRDTMLKSNMPKRRSIRAWRKIQQYRIAGDDQSLKFAVIEAENLLNEALHLLGFTGENFGDRLKQITVDDLPNVEDLWEAHKLRNRIVHETNFRLPRDLAERALAIYERAFHDLGLLD